jgi:hypothetical protein
VAALAHAAAERSICFRVITVLVFVAQNLEISTCGLLA